MKKTAIAFVLAVVFLFGDMTASGAKDLAAVIGLIPPHSEIGEDDRPRGGFVEVVRAIDSVYKEGRITIGLFPIARAINMLINGQADFYIPYIPNPHVPAETLPFAYADEPVVDVSFVLYSDSDKLVPPMDHLENFRIETLRGAAPHFPFKISEIDSFRQGILRVDW